MGAFFCELLILNSVRIPLSFKAKIFFSLFLLLDTLYNFGWKGFLDVLCTLCILYVFVKPRIVLPLQCMCSECAKELRLQSNKCPICRRPFEELIEIKVDEGDKILACDFFQKELSFIGQYFG